MSDESTPDAAACREVGSSVYQVFDGEGTVTLDGVERVPTRGDLVVVPSWCAWSFRAGTRFDLFRFADTPVFEGRRQHREELA
ncbi:hypothetical protein [Nonomuraea sp. NPDC048916]|uniref:hypothetical protein n=1 Tax=Nonomuraea sp. NPDC048916 TaxID=3154232 RepID=UPI0033CD229B